MEPLDLYLYNTVTKRKDKFVPADPNNVRMYLCGPTVYDRPHIGNIRSAVTYDLLYRLLRYLFPKVTYVRNITDIDDKIINACKASGLSVPELTQNMVNYYEKDTASVLCLQPDHSPRATEHLVDMFIMIQKLIDNGHAYIVDGHVFFSVSTYPRYGFLSGRSMNEMIAGARVEVSDLKRHPADFVLWKPFIEGEEQFSFDSPWGRGRPGWHIECSAMSTKFLGNNFDIHCGGLDIMFPHHENEIAQSVCANKGSNFASVWAHNGLMTVNGEKMSKSLGNFILLKDLLDEGIPGVVIRYFYFMTHYRKPMDFNRNTIYAANKALAKLAKILDPLYAKYDYDMEACDEAIAKEAKTSARNLIYETIDALCNDLNTPAAIAKLFIVQPIRQLAISCSLLGFPPSALYNLITKEIDPHVSEFAREREVYKSEKNWLMADSLRNEINERGYNIMDLKEGGFKLSKK